MNFLVYEENFIFFFNSVITFLFRFLISRHPFARLASAYRNKLEDRKLSHDGEYFFNTYSTQIIRYCLGSTSSTLILHRSSGTVYARLASAYRNKLEDKKLSHDGEYIFNTYSTQIIRYSMCEAGLCLQEQTGGQEALT